MAAHASITPVIEADWLTKLDSGISVSLAVPGTLSGQQTSAAAVLRGKVNAAKLLVM